MFNALPLAAPPRGVRRGSPTGPRRECPALLGGVARAAPWLALLALVLLLSGLPGAGDANYYVSVRASGHDYGSPARCIALTEGRFDCTPLQALPIAEGTSLTGLAAPLFAHSGAELRCEVSPSARYSCTTYPVGSVEQAGSGL